MDNFQATLRFCRIVTPVGGDSTTSFLAQQQSHKKSTTTTTFEEKKAEKRSRDIEKVREAGGFGFVGGWVVLRIQCLPVLHQIQQHKSRYLSACR